MRRRPEGPPPEIIGHRGAAAVAPENTAASFRAALEAGARWVELDVRLTSDGRPVVLHDATLERTTSGRGPVRETPWDVIRALDAGSWFSPRFSGERVLDLEAALRLLLPTARVVVEMKTERERDPGLVDAVVAVAHASGGGEGLVLTSFDWGLLDRLAARVPSAEIALTIADVERRDVAGAAAELGARALHPSIRALTARLSARAREAGLAVRPYTVNTAAQLRAAAAAGIDALFTDDPAAMRSIVAELWGDDPP